VRRVSLTDFRNYKSCDIPVVPGKTILIGENAQGKSNFLEALELISCGQSTRCENEAELIGWGSHLMRVRVDVVSRHGDHSLEIELKRGQPSQAGRYSTPALSAAGATAKPGRLQRSVKINGVTQQNSRGLLSALITVSFKATDLNLLRSGPKYRREWLDGIAMRLRPALTETYSNYSKTLAQRNKLLKTIFEQGKVTVSDQDQLLVWDKQLARFGAVIIKQRAELLSAIMPLAAEHQRTLSRGSETLSSTYIFRSGESSRGNLGYDDISDRDSHDADPSDAANDESDEEANCAANYAASDAGRAGIQHAAGFDVHQAELVDIGRQLMKLLKERRHLEIRRKQTTIGPHRDDISFAINDADATVYASQGQQRSLVLALKLAELAKVNEAFDESPLLLLDDVLAELDTFRQGLLLSAVGREMQSIITTTHISDFDPFWLDGADILVVSDGSISVSNQAKCAH
jgi:DNA replication and repair protein RecF